MSEMTAPVRCPSINHPSRLPCHQPAGHTGWHTWASKRHGQIHWNQKAETK